MTLSLPLMNNLCKRWNLPTPVREACDLYFLRRMADAEFVSLLIPGEEPGQVFIREFGVSFEVVFLNDSLSVYTKNGERAQRQEPNDTFYWLSFRSITFDFQSVKCTKSYVLIQVDRPRIREELTRAGAVGATSCRNPVNPRPLIPFNETKTYTAKKAVETYQVVESSMVWNTFWPTFAERSQPSEKDSEESED